MRHTRYKRRPLEDGADEVLKHVGRLWGFDVILEEVDDTGRVVKEREWVPG